MMQEQISTIESNHHHGGFLLRFPV